MRMGHLIYLDTSWSIATFWLWPMSTMLPSKAPQTFVLKRWWGNDLPLDENCGAIFVDKYVNVFHAYIKNTLLDFFMGWVYLEAIRNSLVKEVCASKIKYWLLSYFGLNLSKHHIMMAFCFTTLEFKGASQLFYLLNRIFILLISLVS